MYPAGHRAFLSSGSLLLRGSHTHEAPCFLVSLFSSLRNTCGSLDTRRQPTTRVPLPLAFAFFVYEDNKDRCVPGPAWAYPTAELQGKRPSSPCTETSGGWCKAGWRIRRQAVWFGVCPPNLGLVVSATRAVGGGPVSRSASTGLSPSF